MKQHQNKMSSSKITADKLYKYTLLLTLDGHLARDANSFGVVVQPLPWHQVVII